MSLNPGKFAEYTGFTEGKKTLLPALVIEMKRDKTVGGAIGQLKERNYPEVLKDYGGEVVLAGINYNSRTKVHTCVVERIL